MPLVEEFFNIMLNMLIKLLVEFKRFETGAFHFICLYSSLKTLFA